MRRKLTVAMVAVLVPSAIGCGGSGSLSKGEFTKQAEAVCSRALKTLTAERIARREHPALMVKAQATFFQHQAAAFAGLKPPGDLAGAFDHYKSSLSIRSDLYHKAYVMTAAGKSAPAQIQALERQQGQQFLQATKLTRQLGLKSCR